MAINKLYPTVSQLVPLDKIPSELDFISEGVENILDSIFFKDFSSSITKDGEAGFYRLTLLFGKKTGFTIPGTGGMSLQLNPSNDGSNTEIPLSFRYQWEILKYINDFEISSFDNSIKSFMDIIFKISGISYEQMISEIIEVFIGDTDNNIHDLINKVNQTNGTSLQFDNTLDKLKQIEKITEDLRNEDHDIIQVFYNGFINVNSFEKSFQNLEKLFKKWLSSFDIDGIRNFLKLKFEFGVEKIEVALLFPRKWLKPLDANYQPIPEPAQASLQFNAGAIEYSTQKGFQIIDENSFTFTRSEIGNTGLIVEFDGLKVDLSKDVNIPEATADGRPANFQGVYAATAAITLPQKWFDNEDNHLGTTARLAGYDMLIGTGGISGTIALEVITPGSTNPKLIKKFGKVKGFEIWFTSFDITFKQNKVIESNIIGGLKIPRLKDANGDIAEIEITGHLDNEGDFLITAAEKDGFAPIKIPQVLDLYIQSLEVGKEDDNFFIGTSCEIVLTNPVMKKLLSGDSTAPTRILIPKLRIYSDGSFEIVGGTIAVPVNFNLHLGPVDVSITGINFGSHQREYQGKMRKYNCWGFDGAISINPLGVEVRGDGVKYYYTTDDGEGKPHDSYIHIKTITVDLIIPGNASPATATAIINGYVSIPEPGVSTEYSGSVSVKLPKAKIAGSAEMRFIPKHPAFIIDASMSIPTPIPIASTGLAFTGFRGLLGFRYVAEKEAVGLTSGNIEDTWYDYYVYPKRGVNIPKFSNPEQTKKYKNPVSIGAGATISTAEGGTVFSTRVMILLSIPSLFLIDGRASILSKEYGLDDSGEPPFFAFLAYGDNSIEAGIGADFKLPQDTGDIIRLFVNIEAAFFFNNPSAWYIHIGTRQKPNEARILDMVTVQAYLQLSARGIEAGARAEFLFDKKFGPAKVKAWLFIEVGGKISFEKPQIGGYIEAGGGLEVSFWVLRIGIEFYAIFSAEAPKPFLIYAEVRVCGRIKIGFVKIKKCITAKIKWEKSRHIDKSPVPPLLPERANDLVKGVSMLTGEGFELQKLTAGATGSNSAFDKAVLPLDSYIDIKFNKPVLPNAVRNNLGGVNNTPKGYTDLIPPQATVKGKTLRQTKHKYAIQEINIQAWANNQWVPYHPYEAVAKGADTNVDFTRLKVGHWQKTGKEYSKIRLLTNNPFSFTEQGEQGWFVPEQLGITASSLFCQGEFRSAQCANWLNKRVQQRYYVPSTNPDAFYEQKGLYFQIEGTPVLGGFNFFRSEYAEISNAHSPFDFGKSLKIDNTNAIVLKFPNPSRKVTLKVSSTARGVNFRFYKSHTPQGSNQVEYALIEEVYKFSSQLYEEFTFESETNTITKVVIDPETYNEERIQELREQIESLFNNGYEDGITNNIPFLHINSSIDLREYNRLLSELEEAKREGCNIGFPPPRGIGAMQLENTFVVGVDVLNNGTNINPLSLPISSEQRCYTLLHEVCWLSVEDYEFNLNIPSQQAIEEDFKDSITAITKVVDPIWRPNTKYRVHFKLSDTVDNETEHTFDYYYGFRTAGPVGHFHIDPKANYGDSVAKPDQYPLTSLRNYIDYKRSYPNANGNLLRAKPLFYGTEGGYNEIAIFFTKPYVYHMLTDWPSYKGLPKLTGEMQIIVKDPIEKTAFNNPPETTEEIKEIPVSVGEWTQDISPLIPEHHQFIANMAANQTCVPTLGGAIHPRSFVRKIIFTNLKPQKMYTTLVNNIFEGKTVEVHNFVFQTSRYIDFKTQVNSYYMKDEKDTVRQAIFNLNIDVNAADLKTAYSTVSGNPDSTSKGKETDQLDWFDRVTEGILKIPPMDPAVTTEINMLKNTNGTIVGILIRNPEPFNDPKIPIDILTGKNNQDQQAIAIVDDSGTINTAYKILYAKDYAQCILMKKENTTIQITDPILNFRFKYLRWNGDRYEVKDSVLISNTLINSTL